MALPLIGAAARALSGMGSRVVAGSQRSGIVLRQVSNGIGRHSEKITRELRKIPPKAYEHFRSITPRRTGNAQRNTNYNNTPTGGSIRGDYPYANRLNEGYSKQAKQGMTRPTIREIRKMVRRIL